MTDKANLSENTQENEEEDELSLQAEINFLGVKCLNEETVGSGKAILNKLKENETGSPTLRSPPDDPELMLYIPFLESVSLQSISISNSTEDNDHHPPHNVKIFVDRDDLDFETARDLPPAETIELLPPDIAEGTIDYQLRHVGRFQDITSITLFFADNFSEQNLSTEILFIELKGKTTKMKRIPIQYAIHQNLGLPQDNKVRGEKQHSTFVAEGFSFH